MMSKPIQCPEQHALIWIDSEIAICKDGHKNIVWVLAENSRLRIEVNATARLIANKLKETLDTKDTVIIKEIVTETVIQYYPKLYTKEEYYTWRLQSKISTTELAKKLKLSRGLMFDVDTGRRPYSDFFSAKFTQFMIDNKS